MCTVVLRIAPGDDFPLILAANRDEKVDRAWDSPGPWWPALPDVIGGRDRSAGGTWMAINGSGVIACVLNRPGSLGPAAGKRSRGELPLIALAAKDAKGAAALVAALEADSFRPFNIVLADRTRAIFQRFQGEGPVETCALSPGVHMVTAHDPDDPESPRIARYLGRFRDAAVPRPEAEDWTAWIAILADRSDAQGSEINVPERAGFATVCSSLAALPRQGKPIWLFAAGPPDRAPFLPISLR